MLNKNKIKDQIMKAETFHVNPILWIQLGFRGFVIIRIYSRHFLTYSS